MNKVRVIDILNKIANGEEDLPDIIVEVEEDKHYYNKDLKEYINQRTGEKLFEDGYGKFLKYYLNDEVEIIEDKKIKKIDRGRPYSIFDVADKLDEIIDYINKEN